MVMPDEPKPGSWRIRREAGWVSAEPAKEPRVEKAATPEEIREKIRRLQRWSKVHFILATFFVLGAVFTYLEKPSGPRSRNVFGARVEQVTEDITHWEVVAMSLGIATVNLVLGLSKQRRAARLAIDPDADHPEARVFE